MLDPFRFAVVIHGRWLDTEPPRATVIRSRDGWTWHDMCTTDPDSADEIAEALTVVEELRAERVAAEAASLVAQHNADKASNAQCMAEVWGLLAQPTYAEQMSRSDAGEHPTASAVGSPIQPKETH